MERSTIKLLKKRGNSEAQIARVLRRDRRTVKRAVVEPTDKAFKRSARGSLVDPYEEKIVQWLEDKIPVTVMFERLRALEDNPYQGGRSILESVKNFVVFLLRSKIDEGRECKLENAKCKFQTLTSN